MTAPLLSLTGARWALQPVAEQRVAAIADSAGLSQVAARCVALRWAGTDLSPGRDWLLPQLAHLHDPFDMHNMHVAVERLRVAARNGERIRIITDYDVDGTTSSLILQAALRLLAPSVAVDYHIPSRFDEGYGFSTAAAHAAAADGVSLIVTADIGVRDHAAVEVAREAGIDVLICDHHLPAGASVPEGAVVLCPPQVACAYPNPHLAACGVSVKLAQALLSDHPRWDPILQSLLKLAAIGTVADLVPLNSPENRAIVALGLDALNSGRHHAGLQALLDVCALEPGQIGTGDLGYKIGPRINAAGRIRDARLVVRLLNCRDPETARQLASELDQLNRERREVQRGIQEAALSMVAESDAPPPFVVVAGPEQDGWHRGVVGIVAARVKDEVHRPTAVVSIQGERAVGSVRSVPAVHAVRALESAEDLLVRFGGHAAAAGFTVETDKLDALRERLCAYVESTADAEALRPVHRVDAEVPAETLGESLFQELRALGPFGMGNPRPRLLVAGARVTGVQVRGKTESLLRFGLPRDGARPLEAVWWRHARHADRIGAEPVDVLGHLEEHRYKSARWLRFDVKDVRPAGSQNSSAES